jgi:MFS family permease
MGLPISSCSWVLSAIFLKFLLLTVTQSQIGIFIAISTFVGIVVEVPSGTLADTFGRKMVAILGFVCLLLFLMAWLLGAILASSWLILLGFILAEVGVSSLSGSLEALAYDSLKAAGKETNFDEVLSYAKSIQIIGLAMATIIGAFLWEIHIYLPLLANGGLVALGVYSIHKMQEINSSSYNVGKDVALRKRASVFSGFENIHRSSLKLTMLVMAVPATLFTLWGSGLVQLEVAERAGLTTRVVAGVLATALLLNYLSSLAYRNIREKLGDKFGFFTINIGMAIGCLILTQVAGSATIGIVGILVIRLFGKLTQAWPLSVVNESCQSEIRATAISTFAFMTRAPYMIALPIYLSLSNNGKSVAFFVVSLLLLGVALLSLSVFQPVKKVAATQPE